MDLKQIKELMAAMEKSGVTRVSLKEKTGFELEIEKKAEVIAPSRPAVEWHPPLMPANPVAKVHESAPQEKEPVQGKYVTSPMVGTYYAAPSPDQPSFVKVGDRIEEHTVVCIIEAMKVMNEVKAGISGVVAEVLLENGHPVEFGTKLFRIV